MAYTQEECLKRIGELYESGDFNKLYDKPFIKNWNGITTDSLVGIEPCKSPRRLFCTFCALRACRSAHYACARIA